MKVLSLFDGISCGQVALQRAGIGIDMYLASEVDKYAMSVTRKNYPSTYFIGDVRNIHVDNGKIFTDGGWTPANCIDLLIGGSPCQSFTFSGKRNGMTTTDKMEITCLEDYLKYKEEGYEFEGQSYLFWEFIRIKEAIKPKYFLLENVKMDKKWQKVITDAIGVEPIMINSNLVSAQNRQRLYWTNIPFDGMPEDKGLVIRDILDPDEGKYPLTQKHLDGFLRSYKWRCCEIDGKASPLLATYYKQPPHCPYIPSALSDSGYRRLTPRECERLQTLPDNYTEGVSDMQRYKSIGNGWTVDIIAHIFKDLKNGEEENNIS